ncbi:MAG: toxin-antitoxin system TumE family protein [Promethearchaeota archaeon]
MKRYPSTVKIYFNWVKDLLINDPLVENINVIRERIGYIEGFIQIKINLIHSKKLAIFEYYSLKKGITNYRYQLMDENNNLIIRWDSAPHHPEISTSPYHLHKNDKIEESEKMNIQKLLAILSNFI